MSALGLTRAHLSPGLAFAQQLAGQGAVEVGADGAEVILDDGRSLVDFGSYAVPLVGHRSPPVIEAVRQQLDALPTSTRSLANEVTPVLAERLARTVGHSRLRRVWLGSDGSDAVEAALKLARLATGRPRVVAVAGGFHGKTMGALEATWFPGYRAGLEAHLSQGTHVPLEATALDRELATGTVAAIIIEPIQGEGGVVPLPLEILRRWRAAAAAHDTFFICDEVQTGLGRAGERSLADSWGLDPDAVLLGKALGGGVLPISAVICSDELFAPMRSDPFIHTLTFGGHPLSCAAALACLDEIDRLTPESVALAEALGKNLEAVLARHGDLILGIRGRGLMWGLTCRDPEVSGLVLAELAPLGLIVSPCLGRPELLRLLPPMVTTAAQRVLAVEILDEAFVRARDALDEPCIGRVAVDVRVDAGGCTWMAPVGTHPASRATPC